MCNKIILNENSESIKYLSKKDERLKILFNLIGELSYTLYTNPKTIIELSYSQLRNIGISNSKISYIMNLTNAVLNDEINFESFSTKTNIEIEKDLQKIKGIGKWSSKMYLIFVLGKDDILPYEDMAFIQGYSWLYNTTKTDKKSIISKCKKWGKYSSVASRYLYKALDLGYTKIKFSEYKKSD